MYLQILVFPGFWTQENLSRKFRNGKGSMDQWTSDSKWQSYPLRPEDKHEGTPGFVALVEHLWAIFWQLYLTLLDSLHSLAVSAMARRAQHSSSSIWKTLRLPTLSNQTRRLSTGSSISMFPYGNGMNYLSRAIVAAVSVLPCMASGRCSPKN